QGIINDQFSHIQSLKTVEEADCIVKMINTYCAEVETLLKELAFSVGLPDMEFSKFVVLLRQVEEKSSR
ncbi:hypothetical protein CFOL_v3_20569, partial [Cephalotus follicularis]